MGFNLELGRDAARYESVNAFSPYSPLLNFPSYIQSLLSPAQTTSWKSKTSKAIFPSTSEKHAAIRSLITSR